MVKRNIGEREREWMDERKEGTRLSEGEGMSERERERVKELSERECEETG